MTPERIERALVEVTREARTEPLPRMDWDAIEEQLPMTRVRTLPPRRSRLRPVLVAAAAAALALGGGFALRHSGGSLVTGPGTASETAATNAAEHREVNGDTLAPGAHLVADDVSLLVVHQGHARWTLAPHSEGTLLANGELITVRLDRGSVTARVTKSSRTETFAIEAADVRVAAHGTEFVVSLGADGVSVSVSEGSVLVGPRSEPGTGQLLISPSAKRYTHAGKPLEDDRGLLALGAPGTRGLSDAPSTADDSGASSQAERLALDAAAANRRAAARKSSADAPAEEAPPEDLAPQAPSPEELEKATTHVLSLVKRCFKERTIAGEGVRVTAQTSVTFRTLPEGSVNKVVFEPPLSPAVQACVNAGMGSIRTEVTRHGFQASRIVDLER